MRKLATGLLAALAALALGSAAIAADMEPKLDDEETFVTTTAEEEDDSAVDGSTEDDELDVTDDEVDEVDEEETATSFGQTRSAWVKEARLSGEKPGPAWLTPGHPTGGPLGAETDDNGVEDDDAVEDEDGVEEDESSDDNGVEDDDGIDEDESTVDDGTENGADDEGAQAQQVDERDERGQSNDGPPEHAQNGKGGQSDVDEDENEDEDDS
jgi:hypothetical protein